MQCCGGLYKAAFSLYTYREEGGHREGKEPAPQPQEDKKRIEDLWDSFKQETGAQLVGEPTSKARSSPGAGVKVEGLVFICSCDQYAPIRGS